MSDVPHVGDATPAATGEGGDARKSVSARTKRKPAHNPRAPWNDDQERLVMSSVGAARLLGGSCVTVKAKGIEIKIEVKHSRESEPELVKATRNLFLQAVGDRQQRQQSKAHNRAARQSAPPEVRDSEQPDPKKEKRKQKRRDRDKQNRAAGRAARAAAEHQVTADADVAMAQAAVEPAIAVAPPGGEGAPPDESSKLCIQQEVHQLDTLLQQGLERISDFAR